MSTTTRKPGARERLVVAAEQLFYADGIRAVGVDRLCAEAGVSKRSLYQHFSGKDDVVVAVLEAQGLDFAAHLPNQGSPREQVLAVFERTDELAGHPGFHGCPFVAAAVELKDPEHPGSRSAGEHKRRLTGWFVEQARLGGAQAPEVLAQQLTLVFDGASAHAVLQGGPTAATRQTVELLLDAHGL